MGKQGRGRRLTDKERMEIITITRENPRVKHVELAAKYGVNESTIRKWRGQNNASKIEERYLQGVSASRDHRQRGQAVRNTQFDGELYEWVVAMMKQDPDLAPVRIREKARALASLHDGMEGFKASSGWFYRFCRRYGLACGAAGREASEKAAMADVHAAVEAMSVPTTNEPIALGDNEATVASIDSDSTPAAIAASLQTPPASVVQLAQVDQAEQPNSQSHLLLNIGDMPLTSTTAAMNAAVFNSSSVALMSTDSVVNTNAEASPSSTLNSSTVSPPAVFTNTQVAVTHMMQHFKDMLDPPTRLRLVRHLSGVPGEAEMYLVMDDETRIEYIKEFIASNTSTI